MTAAGKAENPFRYSLAQRRRDEVPEGKNMSLGGFMRCRVRRLPPAVLWDP